MMTPPKNRSTLLKPTIGNATMEPAATVVKENVPRHSHRRPNVHIASRRMFAQASQPIFAAEPLLFNDCKKYRMLET